ncbi:hypothetical protein QR97_25340 [Streptomyces sp. PBH53]|nr:hypothetical protein QR97_25340 [Streptomyces sp. PBH53]
MHQKNMQPSTQFGIFSVGDVTPDPTTGRTPTERERIKAMVAIALKAEEVGLDVFATGEHHNPPFVPSSPTTMLGYIAARTGKLILSTSTTLITTNDPVKIAERAGGPEGSGCRDGRAISRASRTGAWTTRGSALPSGRGAVCCEAALPGGGPGAAGCRTVTQPERAETATVTRSAAVVVVRCTRATLLAPPPLGSREPISPPPHG